MTLQATASHWVCNKACCSQLESDWKAYKDLKRQVQKECHKAHDTFVLKLIDDKNSNKQFWSYIKSKRNDQCGVPTLEKDKKIYTDNLNILNAHFSLVFTIDYSPVDNIPLLKGTPFPDLSPLHIEADGINSLLYYLNIQKAHGPDVFKWLSVNILQYCYRADKSTNFLLDKPY